MKDENIKEILDKLNNKAEHYILYNYEVKLLLDCITNLQEKYDRMKENAITLSNGYDDLEKRNEKAIEKLKSIRTFGLRSGKTLFSTLINESIDILQGEDKDVKD